MNKVLITGASGDIGKAIANYFWFYNIKTVSPTRDELNLEDDSSISNFFKENGSDFDIVVNCAGINDLINIENTDNFNAIMKKIMQVNFYAPVSIINHCIPHMIAEKRGRIINIGSILIDYSREGRSIYSASKSALHSFTKSIAVEFGQHDILCNTISPGYIDTQLTHKNNTRNSLLSIIANDVPVGKLGTPQEVAKLVYQLTVNNSFITGQNIIIDGGFSCKA